MPVLPKLTYNFNISPNKRKKIYLEDDLKSFRRLSGKISWGKKKTIRVIKISFILKIKIT